MDGEAPKRPDPPSPDLSRAEDARRIIEDYANDLREILRQLRRCMH